MARRMMMSAIAALVLSGCSAARFDLAAGRDPYESEPFAAAGLVLTDDGPEARPSGGRPVEERE